MMEERIPISPQDVFFSPSSPSLLPHLTQAEESVLKAQQGIGMKYFQGVVPSESQHPGSPHWPIRPALLLESDQL